jgi:hypothetical protein
LGEKELWEEKGFWRRRSFGEEKELGGEVVWEETEFILHKLMLLCIWYSWRIPTHFWAEAYWRLSWPTNLLLMFFLWVSGSV